MKKIDIEEMRSLVLAIADRIIASKPLLTEVDSKIGDGDHGIGMETGGSASAGWNFFFHDQPVILPDRYGYAEFHGRGLRHYFQFYLSRRYQRNV